MISFPIALRSISVCCVLAAFLMLLVPSARADAAADCFAGLANDGKLHSGADPAKVANACVSAAGSGSVQAIYLAGMATEQGIGVSKNFARAEDWYRKAARKGHADAQFALGRLEEAKHKNDQALAWYAQAALKNQKEAGKALIRLRTADPHAVWNAALLAIDIDSSLGTDREFSKSGSGIIIEDGIVLTNEHVIAGCKKVAVAPGIPARVLAADADKDLAVIKTAIPVGAPVPISAGNSLGTEAELFTGGFPGIGRAAPDFTITNGRLSSRKISSDGIKDFWLLTNQINPGNSGGPLMDDTGLVVGVVSAELPVTGIVKKDAPKDAKDGMAIRAEIVRGFLDAHKISYRSAGKGPLTNAAADMDRHAAAATMLVECFED